MDFKIYTKTGDDDTTGLVGGNRVMKSNPRLEAYGTVDELNSHIGLVRAMITEHDTDQLLGEIQNKLFVIGSKLASDEKGRLITDELVLGRDSIHQLELAIDRYEEQLLPLQNFILPGGSILVSHCHIARTVCRRAERRVVELTDTIIIEEIIIQYLNRLSDYLFVLARKIAKDQEVIENKWVSH